MTAKNEVQEQPKLGISQQGVDYVASQLTEKEKKGLYFPPNYSVKNAMQSAYLMLRETEDKNGRPLMQVCTQDSVVQSLMQMATQGLNPIKKQCYFVAYGSKCKLVPSYFGTLAILNRVKNLKRQPVANVVHEGDLFEYGYNLDTMEMQIRKHETGLDNLDQPVIAAYAVIETEGEKVVEIMSRKQLEHAWAQGQSWKSAVKGNYESKTHANFAEEMAKKTVLNRAAKKLINATDDASVMSEDGIQAFNEVDENDNLDIVAEQVEADKQKANSVPFLQTSETVEDSQVVEEAETVDPVDATADTVDDDEPDFM